MSKKTISQCIFIILIIVCLTANIAFAQTTAFSYQGRLTDAGSPANGNYILQFSLFDAASGGTQIGATISDVAVTVNQGVFNVSLDFGAMAFDGANRFLEISVKRNAGDPYTVLAPRQPIVSTPYAVRTLSSAQADISLDSNRLGGIAASEYVTTSSVGNAFIKNDAQQQTANFNISGNGTIGGTLTANTVTAQTGTGFYGLTQTDGKTTVSTYVGGSVSGATGAWFGTQSNSPLHFFTNNSQPQLSIFPNSIVGIGTAARLQLTGSAAQDRASGGFVKALLRVNSNGTIASCYNGITGVSVGDCGGFIVSGTSGTYVVNLGFQVTDRFLSVVARGINPTIGDPTFTPTPISADYRFSSLPNSNPNEVIIDTFRPHTGVVVPASFMLIVY